MRTRTVTPMLTRMQMRTAPIFHGGSGCNVGNTVGNWNLDGYADTNGDNTVEKQDTTVSLADIHCTGKQSLIVVVGDTS